MSHYYFFRKNLKITSTTPYLENSLIQLHLRKIWVYVPTQNLIPEILNPFEKCFGP